jgi:hypothetical protein
MLTATDNALFSKISDMVAHRLHDLTFRQTEDCIRLVVGFSDGKMNRVGTAAERCIGTVVPVDRNPVPGVMLADDKTNLIGKGARPDGILVDRDRFFLDRQATRTALISAEESLSSHSDSSGWPKLNFRTKWLAAFQLVKTPLDCPIRLATSHESSPPRETTNRRSMPSTGRNAGENRKMALSSMNEFLSDYGVVGIPGGATGAQMGGWLRKEIKGLADLKGVKMRIAGVAGEVMSRLGVVPQQLPGGDIYPALERGTINAAEWIGPYDDERLGFYQIAPNYDYPAYWEGGLTIPFFTNKAQYEGLPEAYKAAIINMQVLYDVKSTMAIRSLVGKGVKLRPLPRDVMDAAYKKTFELYAEYSYDSDMYAAQASGK